MARSRSRRTIVLFVSLAWIGPAVLAAFREVVRGLAQGTPPTWRMLVWEGGDWLLYALLTPVVFVISRRYRLVRGAILRRVPLHLAGSILLCAAWAAGGQLLAYVLFGDPTFTTGRSFPGWFITSLPFGVAVYFAVVGVEHAAFYFFEARDGEAREERLATQLEQARLSALRMQMQPHFLYNSLNAISVIVRDRDTETALRMLEQLGDMLRRVNRSDRPHEVPLAEEIDFVRQYLAIEQVRFSDRLRPEIDVDERLMSAAVPEFLLQPLVENALRHGLARRVGSTLLRIEARREGDDLVLAVIDDGSGPEEGDSRRQEGVGLGTTRQRLETLYGSRASLELRRTEAGGAVATVRLPYHEPEAPRG